MSEEEIKLIEEMKENCIKQANYVDVKAMEKYNALRHLQQENSQLKERIEKTMEQIEKQKTKMYKNRNKIALFVLMKLEKILKGDK